MRIGLCCRAVTLWLISILPHPPARQVRGCRNGAPGEERHCRCRRAGPRLRGLRNRHSLLHRIGLSPARPPPFSRLNSAHWTIVTSGPSVQARQPHLRSIPATAHRVHLYNPPRWVAGRPSWRALQGGWVCLTHLLMEVANLPGWSTWDATSIVSSGAGSGLSATGARYAKADTGLIGAKV
jgi:hypothetical protein